MFGLKEDWLVDIPPRYYALEDYEGAEGRWCPGCGDFGVLSAVQRICRDAQIPPHKVVCVSGIGCSSRFPHYMGTYGFHGLHGRAFPVACGIRARRPDLFVWVATGDGDCCSIGAGHWIHAIRYNMDMVVMLFDNGIYGLTKKQTSPTSPVGLKTNTHPGGAWLPPLCPTAATLGMTNVSFVAVVPDWSAALVHAALDAAFVHKGLGFVRILQRCPTYTANLFEPAMSDPNKLLLLTHPNGLQVSDAVRRTFPNQLEHDPSDMAGAQVLASRRDVIPVGLFFQDESRPMYEGFVSKGLEMTVEERMAGFEAELDRFAL